MKKLFAIFTAVVLMPASQSMAWFGGPFSNNNSLPAGDDGIYEATATMSNGVGQYRFAVRNNGSSASAVAPGTAALESSNVQFNGGILAAQSSNVWYYKGITYYGVAFGMANSDAGMVSCVAYASSNTQTGQQGGGVAPPAAGINGIVNVGPSGNNVRYANSSWMATFTDKGPAFRFNGNGEISFVGNVDETSTVEATNPTATTLGTATGGPTFTVNNGVGPVVTPPPGIAGLPATAPVPGVPAVPATSPIPGIVGPPAVPGVPGTPAVPAVPAVPGFAGTTGTTPVTVGAQVGNSTSTGGSNTTTTTNASGSTTIRTTVNNGSTNTSLNSSTHIGTGGETSTFSQKGHVRKFIVFGSKVSHVVAP